MRNLLLFLLILIAYIYVRRALRRAAGIHARRQAEERRPSEPERMVACAHCGVHVPESESLHDDGHDFCCAEHRTLGPRD